MEVALYNEPGSKFDFNFEPTYLRPLLLICDEIHLVSPLSTVARMIQDKEKLPNFMWTGFYEAMNLAEKSTISKERLDEIIKMVNSIKQKKIKSKEEIILLQRGTKFIEKVKEIILDIFKNVFLAHKFNELMPFTDKEILILYYAYRLYGKKENLYVSDFSDSILNNPEYHVFGQIVEDLLYFIPINNNVIPKDIAQAEFSVGRKLFEFPHLNDLTYNQLYYTRENLKPHSVPFNNKLEEFAKEIKITPFNKDNINKIITLYNEKITPLLEPLQESINNELYIQQARQKSDKTEKINFCIGITSIKGMIDYYEKAEIIFPYESEAIRNNISRQSASGPTDSRIFFYLQKF